MASQVVPLLNLRQKFLKVMEDCSYVQKQGENTFHHYKYAMAADVLSKVNESCVKHGIVTVATAKVYHYGEVITTKGNKEFQAIVEMTITLMDTESSETLTLVGLGSGQDTGDKAIMKAETAAVKYAWMMGLNISTGDDPEADAGVDERSGAAPQPARNGKATQPKTEQEKKPEPKEPSEQAKKILAICKGLEEKAGEKRADILKYLLESTGKALKENTVFTEDDVFNFSAKARERFLAADVKDYGTILFTRPLEDAQPSA